MSERRVAGLLCSEVLAALPDFLDDELAAGQKTQVEDHLKDCDWCARFGGEYAAAINALRTTLAEAPQVPQNLKEKLLASLGGE